MKISLEWLSDFIDLSDIAPEVIADRLTMATAEVEGFETIERAVEGVVIAEVLSVEPLPGEGGGGSRLALVTVEAGERTYATVCGAPNVRRGMKVPFAAAGLRLADGAEIAVTELAGRRSEGVLCSARELGFSEFHEGVLECPASAEKGAPLSRYVAARDTIIEIDNKSLTNRPDLLGHYGLARELAAIFGRPLRPLGEVDLARFARLPAFPVVVEEPELCPCYACLSFEVEALAPAPLHIQARLHALGQRSFGLLVDLTNYVMLEVGQPTHAFDAALVGAIRVATAGAETTFRTLDGVERRLLPRDLLICDAQRPVALAGIMGGLETEVTAATTSVLLESANFKGSQIRRTATRLGLRTEASQRFEKNQPPVNARVAVARILALLEENRVAYRPLSRFSVAGELSEGFRPLRLPVSVITRAAGFDLPEERIVSILNSLGFEARAETDGELQVGVPPFRSAQDISIAPDIIEEILRIYGYDNVPPELPAAHLRPVYIDELLRREHKAQRALALGHAFTEVHTYAWMDDFWIERLGFRPGCTLVLRNPSAEGKRQLRTTLVPNLLALVEQNRIHRQRFKLFEVGHVFKPVGERDCEEVSHLACVSLLSSKEEGLGDHYLSIKGAVEDVARVLECGEMVFRRGEGDAEPWKAAGLWVAVELNGRPVGEMGVLGGEALAACAPGGQVVWAELDLSLMPGPIFTQATFQPPPVYPLSWQDFTLSWPLERGYTALREVLAGFSHPLIRRLDFRGVYQEPTAPDGHYTFRYWLGSPERTLAGADLEGFHAALLGYLGERGIALK